LDQNQEGPHFRTKVQKGPHHRRETSKGTPLGVFFGKNVSTDPTGVEKYQDGPHIAEKTLSCTSHNHFIEDLSIF
jgi:hypothetical protein